MPAPKLHQTVAPFPAAGVSWDGCTGVRQIKKMAEAGRRPEIGRKNEEDGDR